MKKWNALRTAVAICLLLCLALMPAALGEGINTGDFDEVYDMLDTWFEDEPAAEEEKTDVDAIYAFTLDGASYALSLIHISSGKSTAACMRLSMSVSR